MGPRGRPKSFSQKLLHLTDHGQAGSGNLPNSTKTKNTFDRMLMPTRSHPLDRYQGFWLILAGFGLGEWLGVPPGRWVQESGWVGFGFGPFREARPRACWFSRTPPPVQWLTRTQKLDFESSPTWSEPCLKLLMQAQSKDSYTCARIHMFISHKKH